MKWGLLGRGRGPWQCWGGLSWVMYRMRFRNEGGAGVDGFLCAHAHRRAQNKGGGCLERLARRQHWTWKLGAMQTCLFNFASSKEAGKKLAVLMADPSCRITSLGAHCLDSHHQEWGSPSGWQSSCSLLGLEPPPHAFCAEGLG